jgi:hypothetical protein
MIPKLPWKVTWLASSLLESEDSQPSAPQGFTCGSIRVDGEVRDLSWIEMFETFM